MRCANRNKQPFWYALYDKEVEDHDENGYISGTHATYHEPVKTYGNISPARGASVPQMFGYDDRYDNLIVIEDADTPIDENAVLWIGPFSSDGDWTNENGVIITTDDDIPISFIIAHPFNYVVKRVSRGLPVFGGAVIAVSRVSVS